MRLPIPGTAAAIAALATLVRAANDTATTSPLDDPLYPCYPPCFPNNQSPSEPLLPPGCLGSYPNVAYCNDDLNNPKLHWYHVSTPDPCKPAFVPGTACASGQCVYIKDSANFCLALPNPDSIYLKNNYYSLGKRPTIVEAEGYVRSFCVGSYLPQGALALPANSIRSLNFVRNYTTTGKRYLQISGKFDCALAGVNCSMSVPGSFDDGGQYDNGGYEGCGKEPYSGVDVTVAGLSTFPNYVLQASGEPVAQSGTPGFDNPQGIFCMRVCEGGLGSGEPCDLTLDTKGCFATMGVSQFPDTFTEQDVTNNPNAPVTTLTVSVPPLTTKPAPTSTAPAASGTAGASTATTKTAGAARAFSAAAAAVAAAAWLLL